MPQDPFHIQGPDRAGRWVVVCDHASNRVPDDVAGGDLGLPAADMARHIAYDPGSEGVAHHLGIALNAPVICSRFSRLVIDPNRGEDDPTLLMRLYDGSIIPANRAVDRAEIDCRLDAFHRPYHGAIDRVLAARAAPVIVSIHSFTPQLQGHPPRPWHIGVVYGRDDRLARPFVDFFADDPAICVGDNQPYAGSLAGDTMDRHAISQNRPHILIELRNDLIVTDDQQKAWAARLVPALEAALHRAAV
jgi:predicted N-formylglutamate amidohydrolase